MPAKADINASRLTVFPQPLVTAAHPMCEWCSWTYSPDMGGTPFALKFPSAWCRKHKHLTSTGAEPKGLMALLERTAERASAEEI